MKLIRFAYAILSLLIFTALSASNPKYEFRGAWVSTITQVNYASKTTAQNKSYLRAMLDRLQEAGINVVIFQVRPSADAFYDSKLELWSRYLCPDGKAPSPYWDPLQFMIDECHARGMELHAWLNPYRVTTNRTEKLPSGHLYYREPERFVKYSGDGRIYFDPGLPINRDFIAKVVADILDRYDVDGVHFDDYFYPYPVKGKPFPDDKSFKQFGKGMKRDDWRRRNVDLLIDRIDHTIRHSRRPWVRFGVSPFGIWRNKKTDPKGSDTSGLQNYDDLYADVLLWAESGWIDYVAPQLYWELDHKRASSLKLADWWEKMVPEKCHLYFGQDVARCMTARDIAPSREKNQLNHKIEISRKKRAVLGNCWWCAYNIYDNKYGIATTLASGAHNTPALVPPYTEISHKRPEGVKKANLDGKILSWEASKRRHKATDHVKFVVYRFDIGAEEDYENPSNIFTVTPSTEVRITRPGVYAVTAIDRVNNESKPSKTFTVK